MQLGEIANTKTIKSEHSNSMYLALRYEMGCPPSSICARRALKFSRRADHCSRVPQGCLGMLTAWLVGETYSSPLPIMLGRPSNHPISSPDLGLLPFAFCRSCKKSCCSDQVPSLLSLQCLPWSIATLSPLSLKLARWLDYFVHAGTVGTA